MKLIVIIVIIENILTNFICLKYITEVTHHRYLLIFLNLSILCDSSECKRYNVRARFRASSTFQSTRAATIHCASLCFPGGTFLRVV